jgi:hypothetical protein
MKLYGFKYRRFVPEPSLHNENVGTWIGICGTFLFLLVSAEAGGFRGSINGYFFFILCFLACFWFINLLANEHRWARYLLIYSSLLCSVISLVFIVFLALKGSLIASLFGFFILNSGVFYLARRKKTVL